MNTSKPPKHIKKVTRETIDVFPPYEKTGDYILSKKETIVISKVPKWGETAVLDLVLERDVKLDLDVALEAKRAEFRERRKYLLEQWADLEVKENTLRQSFLYFNKFVKENMEKRERASKKAGEERILKEKRTVEVIKLKAKMEHLLVTRKNMEQIVRKHTIYENCLTDLVKYNPEFKNVDDILNRFETLQEARNKLTEIQEESLHQLEEVNKKFLKLSAEKKLEILGLNNVLASLEERYKHVNEFTLQKEVLVDKIKTAFIQRTAEVEIVKNAAWSIYSSMCRKRKIPTAISINDTEHLLIFIQKSIRELSRIQKMMLKNMKRQKK